MIILAIEGLIIWICIMIFSTLILDEKKKRARQLRTIRLSGYWDGPERREDERLNATLEVKYLVSKNRAAPKISQSKDISSKGIKLLLDEKIDKQTPLALEIKVPDQNRIIKASGEVVWAEEAIEDERRSAKRLFNTGIRISSFREADEKILFDFIRSLKAQKS
jgi:c-di-GMP-binding flagellar brake protein YcgR